MRSLVFVVAVMISMPAFAENKAAAREAFVQGTKHYDLNQFADALDAFKRAYWNYEDPVILFNIAQCHRALGNNKEALAFYRSYLRKMPDPPNLSDAQRFISELEAAIARERSSPAEVQAAQVVALAPPPSPAPLAAVVQAPPKTERPLWKRAWIWGLVGGVVAASVIVGVGVGVGLAARAPVPTDGEVTF